jgi:hypothetical protein
MADTLAELRVNVTADATPLTTIMRDAVATASADVDRLQAKLGEIKTSIAPVIDAANKMQDAFEGALKKGGFEGYPDVVNKLREAFAAQTPEIQAATDATSQYTEVQNQLADAEKRLTEAEQTQKDVLKEVIDAKLAGADATQANTGATQEATDVNKTYNDEVTKGTKLTQDDVAAKGQSTTANTGLAATLSNVRASLVDVSAAIYIAKQAWGLLNDVYDATVGQTMATNEAILRMSQTTGLSTDAVAKWRYAAEQAGGTLQQVNLGFRGMATFMGQVENGTATATAALSRLGITTQEFLSLSPEGKFDLITNALSKVTDGTKREQLALQIFGRFVGYEMLPIINNLVEANKKLKDNAYIPSEADTKQTRALAQAQNDLSNAWAKQAANLTTSLIPALKVFNELLITILNTYGVAANAPPINGETWLPPVAMLSGATIGKPSPGGSTIRGVTEADTAANVAAAAGANATPVINEVTQAVKDFQNAIRNLQWETANGLKMPGVEDITKYMTDAGRAAELLALSDEDIALYTKDASTMSDHFVVSLVDVANSMLTTADAATRAKEAIQAVASAQKALVDVQKRISDLQWETKTGLNMPTTTNIEEYMVKKGRSDEMTAKFAALANSNAEEFLKTLQDSVLMADLLGIKIEDVANFLKNMGKGGEGFPGFDEFGHALPQTPYMPGDILSDYAQRAKYYAGVSSYAEGGTVSGAIGAPQLATVHGGEFITPVGGNMGGDNITINVNGFIGTKNELVQAVREGMLGIQRRNVTTGIK